MRQAMDSISQLLHREKVFFAEQPGEYSRAIVKKLTKLVNARFGLGAPIRSYILERRFPIDALIWRNLLANAPSRVEELLRNRNSDLLLWLKTDKNGKRLKIQVLRPYDKHLSTLSSHFSVNSLEPVPVADLHNYSGVITLFLLAHSAPCISKRKQAREFARHMCRLMPELSHTLTNPPADMPRSFVRTAQRLQAWIWFYTGAVHEDKAKLGRATRAYEKLLNEWPSNKDSFEYGQTLSNFAALALHLAHQSSDAESYEKTLDHIQNAQAVFPRLQHPVLWAQLQEMKAEAQYCLGERHSDLDYYETSIHTFLTIRKIWRTNDRSRDLARTLKRLGQIYNKLGGNLPGSEKYTQSLSAFREAVSLLGPAEDKELIAEINLEIARTQIELGMRLSSPTHLQEAVKLAQRVTSIDKKAERKILEAQAGIHLGLMLTDSTAASVIFTKPVRLLNSVLSKRNILTDQQTIKALQLRGAGFDALYKTNKSAKMLNRAAEDYNQALLLIQNLNNTAPLKDAFSCSLPVLYERLAENRINLGQLEENPDLLKEGGNFLEKSLDYIDAQTHPQKWSLLQSRLAGNYIDRSQYAYGRESDYLDLAVQTCRNSLATLQKDRSPVLWAQIKGQLAEALTLSAACGGGTPCLEMAVEAYQKVMESPSLAPASLEKAAILNKMAHAMADLGRREANSRKLESARNIMLEALDIFHSQGRSEEAHNLQKNLIVLDELLQNNCTLTTTMVFDNLDYSAHFNQTLQ